MSRNKAETLRRVLECSVIEFGKNGYHLTRVADIASLARCSTETIYDVYHNKDGLFAAAVDHVVATQLGMSDAGALIATHLDGVDCPILGICKLTTLYGKPLVSDTYPAIILQLFGAGEKTPQQAWGAMLERRDKFSQKIAALIVQGQAERLMETGDPHAAAHLLLRAVGFIEAWRMRLSQEPITLAHINGCARTAVRAFATADGIKRLDSLGPFEG